MSQPPKRKRPLSKSLLLWTRTIHIYLTMFALLAICFFAFTGFMMNHPDWFGIDDTTTTETTAAVPTALLAGPDDLGIVEHLRANAGVKGAVSRFDADEFEVAIDFVGPGYEAEVTVDRTTGEAGVYIDQTGVTGLLAALHQGEDTGGWWWLALDATALMLVLAAASGVTLMLSLPKRRKLGVACLVLGVGTGVAAYLLLVPG